MKTPLKEIKSQDRIVWLTQPKEVADFLEKTKNAFDIAKGKLEDSNGNVEIVMQTAEAFGRGLFAEHVGDKSKEWTMKEWLESVSEQIFNPLGTGVTFTKITDEEADSLMFRSLLHEDKGDPHMASLFTYGFVRGMFLSAFPDGEILMKSTMAQGAPMTKFVFKTDAAIDDRFERERVKTLFTTMKKE
ncbi:MAG: hypothetical protein DRO67_05455 [Candidatus Asgardarchaeum californiense]|nr:MAG: hypothetical protein DRO67_05455 [Candidatus Asgardarchaeum californiense]